ncbi:hypothetical protein D3C85_1519290 [compost metagenome]
MHRGIELAFQAPGGLFAELLAPGFDDVALGIGVGGKEVRDFQGVAGFRECRRRRADGSEEDGEIGHLHGGLASLFL